MQEAVSATATRLRRIRDDGWSKETPRTGRVDTNRKRPETHATQPLSGDFTTQQPELLAFASLNRPPPTPFPPVDVGPIGSICCVTLLRPTGRSAPSIPPPRTHIWDVQTRQTAGRPLKGHTDAVFSVESPPEGARIVSESRDRAICTRDANTGQMIGQSLKGHTHAVHSVACSPSGAHIVSGSDDRTIRIRDACTDRMVGQPLEGHTRMEVGPKKSVKDESHAERPDSCRDDAHREDVAPYSTRANSVDEHSLVSLSKPTIPPLNPQTRHSTFVSPTVPGLRGPNTLIASLHPAHQKPTSIKKEEASYEHGLGGPGNNPGAGRECKTLSLGYYPPSGRKPCSRGRIPQLSLFPCFTRKPGRATLPALFSKYLQSPGIPQNPPFFLFWRLIAKFAAKTKTYGNIPTGGQNFSGFPTGSDTPFTPSEHNWDLGLGDGSEIWSGQGPGNQLDSQYQTELEQDVLAYLARKYRQSLVPYPRDPIPNPPTGFVDVPPPPPIPLPSNPLPLPSSSALPVGAGLTPNSVINPPAPSQLSHSALDSYISYDNTETSTSSNYHPPIPYNLWGGEYSSISILPTLSNSPPNFNAASEGLDYESYGASWSSLLQSDPVDQHDSQPIPTSLNEFNDLVNDLGSGGSVFGHISADDPLFVISDTISALTRRRAEEAGGHLRADIGTRLATVVRLSKTPLYRTTSRPHYSRREDNSDLDNIDKQKCLSRLPISNVRTVLGLPVKPVTDLTRQTSLVFDDHTAPPPSYDSLFAFASANGTSKEVIKVHSPPSAPKDVLPVLLNEVHHVASSLDQPLPSKADSAGGTPATSRFKAPHECGSSVMLNLKSEELQASGSHGHTSLETLGDQNATSTTNTLGNFLANFNILFKHAITLNRPPSLLKSLMGNSFESRPLPIWNPYSPSKPLWIKGHAFSTRSSPVPITPAVSRRSRTSLRWTVIKAQAIPNLPVPHFDDNRPSGSCSLENGGQLWSGQGPGHGSLDVESLQVWSDKYARLESLAQELGFRLIPTQHFDLIRASLGQLFDLAPQSPAPLQGYSPPGNSSAPPLADIGSNFNSASPTLPAPNDIAHSTFGGHENAQNPTSSVYPLTASFNPQTEQVHTTAPTSLSPVIPGDLSWDWVGGLGDQPTTIPQPPSDTSSPVAIPAAPGLPDTTQEQFSNESPLIHDNASENDMNQLPSTSTSAELSAVDSPNSNYNTAAHTINTSRVGATRTTKRIPCPFENCTKDFRRSYLLDAHLSFCHEGKKAFPCTFQGCNKAYSLKVNMQRHYRSTHQGLDDPSTAGLDV
ncbi:hypothetical protein FRC09_020340 [Ceratobasidium sp. 395]|nr:hypothetical protein FRC09_020340 [Ceratobasidium sp. 395]